MNGERNDWTDMELRKLATIYYMVPREELLRQFPGRTIVEINTRARRLIYEGWRLKKPQ